VIDDIGIRLRLEDEVRTVTGLSQAEISTLSNRALVLCLYGGTWERSDTRREENERLKALRAKK